MLIVYNFFYILLLPVLILRDLIVIKKNKLTTISSWNGRPLYIPKVLLKAIAPLGDIYKLISNNTPLLCSESARVLTHGHIYEGLKAKENLNIQYTNVDEFIKKSINWLIEENYISLSKI